MFANVFGRRGLAHEGRVRDTPSAYRENRSWRFRAILDGGRFTIHDVVNDTRIRGAVREQWRLGKVLDEDREIEAYIAYLEWIEVVTRGELPRPPRRRQSPAAFETATRKARRDGNPSFASVRTLSKSTSPYP
jgi:hypothetical protein